MPIPNQDFPENTLYKFKTFQGYTQKGNEISFWAFLLCIFIYISIFYIFNLSLSSVLNNTKFWFFISNTLILIIAADFCVFSLSRKEEDSYNKYVKISQKNNLTVVGSQSQYRKIVNTTIPSVEVANLQGQEKIKKVVQVDDFEIKPVQNNLPITLKNDFKNLSKKYLEDIPRFTQQADNDFKSCDKIVCAMYKLSSPAKGLEDNTIKCQIEYENYDTMKEGDGEESEFSKMSNEELNLRVEEFIRRCNTQIRLQATDNKINIFR